MLDTLTRPARPQTHAALAHAALANYGKVSLEARIASASPHKLVALLFDRLAQTLREARSAANENDPARRLRATERALAIIDGLDASLDDARGGDVAASLHQVYALLRTRLLAGREPGLGEALGSVEELASAWRSIG
jgi:flagellar protein FliS